MSSEALQQQMSRRYSELASNSEALQLQASRATAEQVSQLKALHKADLEAAASDAEVQIARLNRRREMALEETSELQKKVESQSAAKKKQTAQLMEVMSRE